MPAHEGIVIFDLLVNPEDSAVRLFRQVFKDLDGPTSLRLWTLEQRGERDTTIIVVKAPVVEPTPQSWLILISPLRPIDVSPQDLLDTVWTGRLVSEKASSELEIVF